MSGLSNPRILFGVYSLSPYSRATRLPYGIFKVIGSASIAMTASVEQLYGGASRFAWAAESKTIETSFNAKVKAFPGFLFAQFIGANDTVNSAETGGSVAAIANWSGTSVMSSTTGIASVGIVSMEGADVLFGQFVVVAVSSTTVDVYAMSDIDFARGLATATFQDDALKITATPLTITASTSVTIPGTGLSLTGGSGTIGMNTGDTAYFRSRPINTASEDIVIGQSSTGIPAFGAVILAQKRSDGEMFEIEAYNCIASGFPVQMDEMAFSTTEMKVTCIYDSVQNAVFKIRAVTPSTFT